jgi:HAD superfamily hydrolase (TIGR01509 family)
VLTTVIFDVGETLVDETRLWAGWARWLAVPEFTLYGIIGGLAARGVDHQEFVPLLRPGTTFTDERAAKEAAGQGWASLGEADLYPDALPCLRAVKADGWQVVVGGNQPATFQRTVEQLDLPVDVVTSSGSLGVAKPSPDFFRAVAALAGVAPEQCVHVGDRVDNDVVGAAAAGMTVVHLRRGPWGVLHAGDPVLAELGAHRLDSLTALPALLRDLRGLSVR